MSSTCSQSKRRRLARRAVVFLACAIVIAATGTGRAYQQYGVPIGNRTVTLKWNRMPVQYYVRNVGIGNVSVSQLQSAIDAAFTTWHDVSTAAVSAQFVSLTNTFSLGNGLTELGFDPDPGEPDVLGATDWMIDTGTGEIVESDIFFNSAASVPWSVAAGGETGRFDLQSIATHEIGHLFGLGHSALGETTLVSGGRRVDAKAAVMFPIAFSPGNTLDRNLQPDDIAGISDLYPSGGFQANTGSVTGTVTKNGSGVFGAHVVAFSPTTGTMIGNFTQDSSGAFTISGLAPGPVVLRVEPVDDADLDSFFDSPSRVDINFKITYYPQFAIVAGGGNSGQIRIQVAPK